MSSFGGTVKLTGESDYRKALREISSELKVLNSEMNLVTSQYDKNDKSVENLSSQNEVLNKKIEEQEKKVGILKEALAKSAEETGENSETTKKWQVQLNNAQADLNKMSKELDTNAKNLDEAKEAEKRLGEANKTTINGIRDFSAELLKSAGGASNLGKTIKDDLSVRVGEMKDKVKDGVDNIKAFGDAVVHPKKLGEAIKSKLVDIADNMTSATKEEADAVEDFGKETEKSGEKTVSFGEILKANLTSEAIIGGVKALASGIASVGKAMVDFGKDAIDSFGELEQNLGGSEAVFGEYASTIQKIGEDAYKNLGVSQSEYLATANKMGALFQGSGVEQEKSLELTSKAMQRAADMASVMGIDMQVALDSVAGAAKGNFTMMDNLGVAINATSLKAFALKEGLVSAGEANVDMKKVANAQDALTQATLNAEKAQISYNQAVEKYGANSAQAQKSALSLEQAQNKVSSAQRKLDAELQGSGESLDGWFNNLSQAEKSELAMQMFFENTEQYAGNFAKESTQTISGSFGLLQSSVQSLMGGLGNADADIVNLSQNIIDAALAVVDNVEPIIENIISAMPVVIDTLVGAISEKLPDLLDMGVKLLNSLLSGISQSIGTILPVAMSVIQTLTRTIIENLPMIIEMGIQMLTSLINGIADMLPELIPMAINCILTIVDTLIDNIDLIIDSAINIIMALAEGLLEALPDLVDKIPFIIDKLVDAIFNNFDKILDAGIEVTLALADGLVDALPKLLEKIPMIVIKIVGGLIGAIPQLIKAGGDLLAGLFKGLLNPTTIWNSVKSLFNGIVGGIKELFGIHSPSKVFEDEVGKNLALGLGEGFEDTMSDVTDEMASAIPTEFDADINTNMKMASGSQMSTYDMMVSAFEQALSKVKVVMDDREMGGFVTDTVERVVYA